MKLDNKSIDIINQHNLLIKKLDQYETNMLSVYVMLNCNAKEVSRQTTISYMNVIRTVNKAIKKINDTTTQSQ